MPYYYKSIYQPHYQDPRDPYLRRIDRHDPNLTHHIPRGFDSGIGASLDIMSARARQHQSKPRRVR